MLATVEQSTCGAVPAGVNWSLSTSGQTTKAYPLGTGPQATWLQVGTRFIGTFDGIGEDCLGDLLFTDGLRIVFACGGCQAQVYLFNPL